MLYDNKRRASLDKKLRETLRFFFLRLLCVVTYLHHYENRNTARYTSIGYH